MSNADLYCRECGRLMGIDANGIANHLLDPAPAGSLDAIDHDADGHHVAIAESSERTIKFAVEISSQDYEAVDEAYAALIDWAINFSNNEPAEVLIFSIDEDTASDDCERSEQP